MRIELNSESLNRQGRQMPKSGFKEDRCLKEYLRESHPHSHISLDSHISLVKRRQVFLPIEDQDEGYSVK